VARGILRDLLLPFNGWSSD